MAFYPFTLKFTHNFDTSTFGTDQSKFETACANYPQRDITRVNSYVTSETRDNTGYELDIDYSLVSADLNTYMRVWSSYQASTENYLYHYVDYYLDNSALCIVDVMVSNVDLKENQFHAQQRGTQSYTFANPFYFLYF